MVHAPDIDDILLIKWTDSTTHRSQIIERRPSVKALASASSSSSSSIRAPSPAFNNVMGATTQLPLPKGVDPHQPDSYDYYVHFVGFDRRLDQWDTFDSGRMLTDNIEGIDGVNKGSDDGASRNDEAASKAGTDDRSSSCCW